ncbi:MAG: hypothetical protein RL065_1474 [Bacteroidota bacterium]|jgi:tRNA 2-selenouridine synthase
MQINKIQLEDALLKINAKEWCVIDARSEDEFLHAHLPKSINIPLLNNNERKIVGTLYKGKGRQAAVLKGLEMVGPRFDKIISIIIKEANGKAVIIYCWRGGMRSQILAWLCGLAGLKVLVIDGGYKSYRRWCMGYLNRQLQLNVLGGATGSGKTKILNQLKPYVQVLDLEALASHRGSAFGSLGQGEQPSNEAFENSIAFQLFKFDLSKIIWVENESRLIGRVKIPDSLYNQLVNAPLLRLKVNKFDRIQNIIDDYGSFSIDELILCTKKLDKRMGGYDNARAIALLETGDKRGWVELMLDYYDKQYEYSLTTQNHVKVCEIEYNASEINHFDINTNKITSFFKTF